MPCIIFAWETVIVIAHPKFTDKVALLQLTSREFG